MPVCANFSCSSNLTAAAAALVAFGIGPSRNCQQKFTIFYSNHGPNMLLWRYKQFAKLEFDEQLDKLEFVEMIRWSI